MTKDTTFLVVDQVTTSLVSLQNVAGLQPTLSIDHPLVISKLLRTVRWRPFRRPVRHSAHSSLRITSYSIICAQTIRCTMHVQLPLYG